MRFKKNFKIKIGYFDEIAVRLDADTFLDNLVLHSDSDIDWAISEKLGTYERLCSMLRSRDAYKIQTEIYPFGKFMGLSEHDQNKYSKRMGAALGKIVQIAELSFK